jgi:uncharacterized phosphosugar-binding protein
LTAANGSVAGGIRRAALDAIDRLDLVPVAAAARALATRVRAGGLLQTFGSGHSQLLALEGFYRAGGPAWLRPLVDDRLSPVRGFSVTAHERSAGLGRELAARLGPADSLLVVSTSGRNTVPIELAETAAAAGLLTIAITTRGPGNRLAAVVEHVLDAGVPVGDASVEVGGARMGPLSTVVGGVLLHGLLAETEAALGPGSVLVSNNLDGGDAHNRALIDRYPHLRGLT